MSVQVTAARQGKGLCLLSLDAGGARVISQLHILSELMHRLNFDVTSNEKLRPCDVFEMIGGSGSGGFIAILLALFALTVEQALEEFSELSESVLENQGVDAAARTAALKIYINRLLEKHGLARDARLLDRNEYSKRCKLMVPISYKHNVRPVFLLRNYDMDQKREFNFTFSEAMLATLAIPPLFTPTSISSGAHTLEFISADLTLPNPTRRIVAEAHETFGGEVLVACLLNLGCGHPGILATPEDSESANWIQFLEGIVKGGGQEAEDLELQMGPLGLYHRFSATRGLEAERNMRTNRGADTAAHVAVYLAEMSVSRSLDICVSSLRIRDGITSLEQLKHCGSQNIAEIPLPPVTKTFVMRKEPWEVIEKAIFGEVDFDGPRMLAVTGIGGCGKTQLILKFMRVHKDRFTSRFFIDGSSVARIRADTIRHVRSLGFAHSQVGFEESLLFLGRRSPTGPRILLYDNVDDPDLDMAPLLPSGESCAIILTSRNRLIGNLCPGSHLNLDVMSMEEAMELLLYPGHSSAMSDQVRKDSRTLAEALGYLPIALQQARSYMFETQCTAGEYLQRFGENRDRLLAQPAKFQLDMAAVSTYAAFQTSFEKLDDHSQTFLRLLSYFHWSKFPLELVKFAAERNFSEYSLMYTMHDDNFERGKAVLEDIFLRDGKWATSNLDEIMIALQRYSLITLDAGFNTKLVHMHPLAHGWVLSCVREEQTSIYEAGAILLLALGSGRKHTLSAQYLVSHVIHMNSVWDQLHINTAAAFGDILCRGESLQGALQLQERVVTELSRVVKEDSIAFNFSLQNLADTYSKLGRYKDAESLQLKVLNIQKKINGEQHLGAIVASSNLAATYHSLGQLKEAEALQEHVLKLTKEMLGERHLDTITASSNLAATYHSQGRLKEAEALQEHVLKLRKEMLGERHLDTITASSNLAATYHSLGRLKGAEALQEHVLKLAKEMLGERHLDTVTVSSNLAATFHSLGRLKDAESLWEDVLKLRKEMLGERHLDTITASSNLATTYHSLGRLKEAEALQEHVLKLTKEMLGERHLDTITVSINLAATYHSLDRLKEAEALQEHVLKLRKEMLGDRDLDTITASSNLAVTYHSLGRLKEAEALQEDVLKLREDMLGERHLDTITASGNLAATYLSLGRLKEAEALQEHVLKLTKEMLGGRHLDTIMASSNLAATYHSLGRLKEAEALQEHVLKLRKEMLGERHLDTITASSNLAATYHSLGRLKGAEALWEDVLKLRKEMLGERHLDTITASSNLATTYHSLGRLKEAEALQEHVLKLTKEMLGERHLDTITVSSNLAATYHSLGRLKDAEALREDVLKLRKEMLGDRDLDTITASSDLAVTYHSLGRLKEAEALQEDVLKLRKEMLGGRDLATITASSNLATIYRNLGRVREGEALQSETLRQAQEILGNEHPTTTILMLTMAEIHMSRNRKKDALELLDAADLIILKNRGKKSREFMRSERIRARVQALADPIFSCITN